MYVLVRLCTFYTQPANESSLKLKKQPKTTAPKKEKTRHLQLDNSPTYKIREKVV
jgi:hypothetical protein